MRTLTIYEVYDSLYFATVPKIILKILEGNKKIILLCKDYNEVKTFDNLMWTFSQLSFVPHSTENDICDKNLQDLFITTKLDRQLCSNKQLIFLAFDSLLNIKISLQNNVFIIIKSTDKNNIQCIHQVSVKNI